ncbi:MAG TPA: NAD-dependent epimerase/dehydratase family protein [Acidimicrobiales bacterium]|jgi:nucleoside-diphosphate-sugar epimerase|nr:NAD-dependent epimerase/dehydratase family protein [Acidimicrobiales bacterium]
MLRYAATGDVGLDSDALVVDAATPVHLLKGVLSGVSGLAIGADVAPAGVRSLLEAAGGAGVGHVVLVSSAVVYGAWPDNPVPLSEDAPLRPNPGFQFAAERAEAERLALDWRDAHPGSTVAVLRPTVVLRGGGAAASAFDMALSGTAGLRPREASRPMQFLAGSDLASAAQVALDKALDGPFNVAPDGWVPDETARALAGGPARFPVPERLARVLRAVGGSRTWPGLDPYTRQPWVVANDRLKAAGWTPSQSNEEAFVDLAGSRWPELSPKRRQEVALAGSAGVLAGVVALVVWLVRRSRRPL